MFFSQTVIEVMQWFDLRINKSLEERKKIDQTFFSQLYIIYFLKSSAIIFSYDTRHREQILLVENSSKPLFLKLFFDRLLIYRSHKWGPDFQTIFYFFRNFKLFFWKISKILIISDYFQNSKRFFPNYSKFSKQ